MTGTQQNEGGRIVVTGNPGSGNSSDPYRQFNVAAFTTPGLGSLGLESGRNFLYRSPINSWDISLSKEFRIKERAKFELRLDTFNTLNHTQFDTHQLDAECHQPDQPDTDQPGFGKREQDRLRGGHRGASAAQHADLGPLPILRG